VKNTFCVPLKGKQVFVAARTARERWIACFSSSGEYLNCQRFFHQSWNGFVLPIRTRPEFMRAALGRICSLQNALYVL
jgi:hypothetical protein